MGRFEPNPSRFGLLIQDVVEAMPNDKSYHPRPVRVVKSPKREMYQNIKIKTISLKGELNQPKKK